jgi:hypothetical protein
LPERSGFGLNELLGRHRSPGTDWPTSFPLENGTGSAGRAARDYERLTGNSLIAGKLNIGNCERHILVPTARSKNLQKLLGNYSEALAMTPQTRK